ncbi:MAG: YeeE/YedE family protein [Gemmatimonadetes bacterium]|nr:YeeE/YedE family protein [Gemmatimonadota bacterium]
MDLIEPLRHPWPWYVAGPLIGLLVPLLLWLDNLQFGISSNLRHLCAALIPGKVQFFQYDWKRTGAWNLAFMVGIVLGGFVGGWLLAAPEVNLAAGTKAQLAALGVTDFRGLAPREVFSWSALFSPRTLVSVVIGGFLVGFGTAYAGGCTSGHGIAGLANLERASLIAVLGFFAGGLLSTYVLLPLIF